MGIVGAVQSVNFIVCMEIILLPTAIISLITVSG